MERPAWIQYLEDDARNVLMKLVFGGDNMDCWKVLVDTAKRWKAYLAENPPSDDDDDFFSEQFVLEDQPPKQVKPKEVNAPDHGELILLDLDQQNTEGRH